MQNHCNQKLAFELPYTDLLTHLRHYFPSPVHNPDQDAYLAQCVQQGLQALAALKSDRPHLGQCHTQISAVARLPEAMSSVEDTITDLAAYLEGLTIWSHPHSQGNVSPPATIPAVVGQLFAGLHNPNLLWDDASQRVGLAEREVAMMCADLIGYDPADSAGLFTFGGTGTLLYGVKLGIEKAAPGAMRNGVPPGLKLFASDAAHYAKLNVLGWLGIGTAGLVTVPTGADSAMDVERLEVLLRASLERGERIAAIVATLGTTDAFGIDRLGAIVALRDRLAAEYGLSYLPHIHADAVIGWAWAVFNDYDFAANPLAFPVHAVRSLLEIQRAIQDLRLADSVGLDFHKTGFGPYTSSLFLCRQQADLKLIARDPAEMPYVCQFGAYQPGVYTLETSRGGGAVLAALASLKLLGKTGYRVLLGHIVTMAEVLRERLEQVDYACVVNAENHGPATVFRIYPEGIDAVAAYQAEITRPELRATLQRHNAYNRAVFEQLRRQVEEGAGIVLSFTERYRVTSYGEPILALKSFLMSPFTREQDMAWLVECVAKARREIAGNF